MAKVSSAPEDAYHFKGSFEEGWGKIISAAFVMFQFPPAKETKNGRQAGDQDPRQLMARLEIQRYADGEGTKAASQPEEVLLPVQKPPKTVSDGDDYTISCTPGKYVDGNPENDVEDQGNALGTEGDTLFAQEDGYQINEKAKWMRFTQSLQEAGFKPSILKNSYAPDLVGLYAYFKNMQVKGSSAEFDANYFVVEKGKVAEFPYEKKGAAKGAAKPAAAKPAPAAKSAAHSKAAAPAAEPAEAAAGELTAQDIAEAIIKEDFPKLKQKKLKSPQDARVQAIMCTTSHKPAIPAEMKKAVQDQLSGEWICAFGVASEIMTEQADGSYLIA